MCIRDSVCPDQRSQAQGLCGSDIEYFEIPVDDLWIRDSGPSFLVDGQGGLAGSVWNFNGWGDKQPHVHDAEVAATLLKEARADAFNAPMVTEGGALEVDGDGTLICTESSILNAGRNPGMSKDVATRMLMGWLGVEKVVWLPDLEPDYWTDGHIDRHLRFVAPGHVLLESRSAGGSERSADALLRSLEAQTDARGRSFRVTRLDGPRSHAEMDNGDFCDRYLDFYLANGGLVALAFGDEERDAKACETLSEAYPDRRVRQIRVDALCAGGSGIHCATLQEPSNTGSSIFASQNLEGAQFKAVTAVSYTHLR